MEKHYKNIIILLVLILTLTGCKKSPEELAKEEDSAKRKAVAENIGSVYATFVNDLTFLLDEKAQELSKKRACFEFKPKEGKASVKFYQHPEVYNLEVKTKNEIEYILIYQGKQADLKLNLKGQLPVKDSNNAEVLQAELIINLPRLKSELGFINDIDVAYKYVGDASEDGLHGRFTTIEECEEKYSQDEEIGKQKSTCEGPGC
ncbi:lipoprotein, tandem type [Leptospira noguchii]|uniref:Lipoprotein, tandem type n=1 Tax=Leptospira noguchii TaxID=28182 RepID=A0A9Q8VUV0_9LEPT|nr:lipoprotein, tandem type [Leptospira noguchii]TQE63835.1 lipoprotein, tandem type [Leptospira noguchii]UOG54117.1 lipoprotein, tandem type [Leptospira noguchii]UOG56313.1 lipoprotein, tandem type [Leptospira noguchii]